MLLSLRFIALLHVFDTVSNLFSVHFLRNQGIKYEKRRRNNQKYNYEQMCVCL